MADSPAARLDPVDLLAERQAGRRLVPVCAIPFRAHIRGAFGLGAAAAAAWWWPRRGECFAAVLARRCLLRAPPTWHFAELGLNNSGLGDPPRRCDGRSHLSRRHEGGFGDQPGRGGRVIAEPDGRVVPRPLLRSQAGPALDRLLAPDRCRKHPHRRGGAARARAGPDRLRSGELLRRPRAGPARFRPPGELGRTVARRRAAALRRWLGAEVLASAPPCPGLAPGAVCGKPQPLLQRLARAPLTYARTAPPLSRARSLLHGESR
jgi:hypothetical protein